MRIKGPPSTFLNGRLGTALSSRRYYSGKPKEFSFENVEWVGFDMDHTLARYNLPEFDSLIYTSLYTHLSHKSHSFKNFQIPPTYHYDFAFKGIIIDKKHGNFLKLSNSKRVLRCYHGKTRLSHSEITSLYNEDEQTIKDLEEFEGYSTARFLPLPTYFERPLAPLLAEIFDYVDRQPRNFSLFDRAKHYYTNLFHYNSPLYHFHLYFTTHFSAVTKSSSSSSLSSLPTGNTSSLLHEQKNADEVEVRITDDHQRCEEKEMIEDDRNIDDDDNNNDNDNKNNDNEKKGIMTKYEMIVEEVMESVYAIYHSYNHERFFERIRSNGGAFVFPNAEAISFLKTLKESGKKLFLVTNSLPQYAALVGTLSLQPGWMSMFDLIVVHSRKPAFWITPPTSSLLLSGNDNNDNLGEGEGNVVKGEDDIVESKSGGGYTRSQQIRFYDHHSDFDYNVVSTKKENGNDGDQIGDEKPIVWQYGNVEELLRSGGLFNNIDGSKICYIGDHLLSDILLVKQQLEWNTVAVIEELESSPNEYWGSYFYDYNENGEKIDTFWAKLIKEGADLTVPCLSALSKQPIEHKYTVPDHEDHPTPHSASHRHEIPSYTIYYKDTSRYPNY